MSSDDPKYSTGGRRTKGGNGSHWEGCYKSHADCADAMIERQAEEIAELREQLHLASADALIETAKAADAEKEIAELRAQLTKWSEREASVCPEDFSFVEVITKLRADLASRDAEIAEWKVKANDLYTKCEQLTDDLATAGNLILGGSRTIDALRADITSKEKENVELRTCLKQIARGAFHLECIPAIARDVLVQLELDK